MSRVHLSVVLGKIDQDLCSPERISALKDRRRQLCGDTLPGKTCRRTEVWRCRAGEGTSVYVSCLCKEQYWDVHGLSYHLLLVI